MLVSIAVGVVGGWLASVLTRVQHERRIVQLVKASGGHASYPHQGRSINGVPDTPPGPWLMRMLFGDDVYDEVHYVKLGPRATADHSRRLRELRGLRSIEIEAMNVDDEVIAHVGSVPHLRWLVLRGVEQSQSVIHLRNANDLQMLHLEGASFENDSLRCLSSMANLQHLDLVGTSITSAAGSDIEKITGLRTLNISDALAFDDAGLREIGKLPELLELRLAGTPVTDDGLVHLKGLRYLRSLNLRQSKVTDAGLRHLVGLKHLRRLELDKLPSDAGLSALGELPLLEELSLFDCIVTDEGMKSIGQLKSLRRLKMFSTTTGKEGPFQVTDDGLLQLKTLNKLEELWIDGHITKEGITQLHDHLPNCEIRGGTAKGMPFLRISPSSKAPDVP